VVIKGHFNYKGCPGTGKTALLNEIMSEKDLSSKRVRVFKVNCMALKEPKQVFSLMAAEFAPGKDNSRIIKSDTGGL
jgi:Cdc6-like AAA superfamily ATPase